MAAYITTNISSSNYTLAQVNWENVLTITDGSNTVKLKGLPPSDSNNTLLAVGKAVYGTSNNPVKVFSAVYKQSPPNSDPIFSFYVAKVDPNNSSGSDIWVNPINNISNPSFLECMVGVDLNNDNKIGPQNLTVVSHSFNTTTVADIGDQVLAKDSSGNFFILDKTNGTDGSHNLNSVKVGGSWFDVVFVREQGSNFQSPNGFDYLDDKNTKNSSQAVAVVKSDTAPPSDGYMPPNQGNSAGYYVAIRKTNEWQNKAQWEIRKINLTGEIEYSNQISTEKISKYEQFFGQDLNGDTTIGAAAPTTITGDSSTPGRSLANIFSFAPMVLAPIICANQSTIASE